MGTIGFACGTVLLFLLIALGQLGKLEARQTQPQPQTQLARSRSLSHLDFLFNILSDQRAFASGSTLSQASRLSTGRHLLNSPAQQPAAALTTPTAAPAPSATIDAGDGSVVIFIQNLDPAYQDCTCLDACSHGFTCAWQNAWVWMCHATNVVDHMWVWEPSGLIRSSSNDSFHQFPELCLDMCEDFSAGSGSCGLTAGSGLLNVGFRECTGRSNQVHMQRYCPLATADYP